MRKLSWMCAAALLSAGGWITIQAAEKVDAKSLRTGPAAFADAKSLTPGTFHKITPPDLPAPYATKSATNFPTVVPRPADAWPKAPAGFKVDLYAEKVGTARQIRTAPNGDFFMADAAGQVRVFRGIT